MTSLLAILQKLARISYKLEIHKVVFPVVLCFFLSKNLYSYTKNTEELKNRITFLIKNTELPVVDPLQDVTIPSIREKGHNNLAVYIG